MKPTLLSLTLLIAFLLSACGRGEPTGASLEGTSWTLDSIAGQSVLPGSRVTLTFADGRAVGEAGCNGYGGTYEAQGARIAITEIVATAMACLDPEGIMEQEAAFLGSLNEVERFELAGGRLRLIRSDGEAVTFVPAQ